jgi:cold shock CspA family protein
MVKAGEIGVATIAAFKGLEAKVVIVVNLSEHRMPLANPIMSSLTYVALTRAKHMLYVLVREDDEKFAKLSEARTMVMPGGVMVLDSEDRAGEFTGKVTYYNSSRLGILEMMTGEELGKTILVLPHDVERSGLRKLNVDQMVRFRIRSEGGVATATSICDMPKVSEL